MKQRYTMVFFASLAVAFAVGCPERRPLLEPYSLQLEPGMTTNDVARLFAGFRLMSSGTGAADVALATVLFQPESASAQHLTYAGPFRPFEIVETCCVYFDAHSVIVGYQCTGYDGPRPDVRKHRGARRTHSDGPSTAIRTRAEDSTSAVPPASR